jgi:hypothetical protein
MPVIPSSIKPGIPPVSQTDSVPLDVIDVEDLDPFDLPEDTEAFLEASALDETPPLETQVMPSRADSSREEASISSNATPASSLKTSTIVAGVVGIAAIGAAVYFLRGRK